MHLVSIVPDRESRTNDIVLQALRDPNLQLAFLDRLNSGVYIVDRERRILYWNAGAERITGYHEHQVVGKLCHGDLLMHCDGTGAILCGSECPLAQVIVDGHLRECTVYLRHLHGHRVPVNVRAMPLRDAQKNILGAIEVFEEAMPAGRRDTSLEPYGCVDRTTGIPTRAYGEMKLVHRLDALEKFGITLGWLAISLNSVSELDKNFGHGFIDAAMKMIARTLDWNVGTKDVLMRWDRTEFRVVVHAANRTTLEDLAQSLKALVRCSAVDWWGETRQVTISIAAIMAEPGESVSALESRVRGVQAINKKSEANPFTTL